MKLRLRFPALPSRIFDFVERVASLLPEARQSFEVRIGLVEALGNAIIHGALGIGSRDETDIRPYLAEVSRRETEIGATRRIDVVVELQPGTATVSVEDPGQGYDAGAQPATPNRGLDIIQRSFSEVRSELGGRRIVLMLGGS